MYPFIFSLSFRLSIHLFIHLSIHLSIRVSPFIYPSIHLEIDSTDANSNAGLSEALGEQNVHVLQNQVTFAGFIYLSLCTAAGRTNVINFLFSLCPWGKSKKSETYSSRAITIFKSNLILLEFVSSIKFYHRISSCFPSVTNNCFDNGWKKLCIQKVSDFCVLNLR